MKNLSLSKWVTAIAAVTAATGVAQVALDRGLIREWHKSPVADRLKENDSLQSSQRLTTNYLKSDRSIGNSLIPELPFNEEIAAVARISANLDDLLLRLLVLTEEDEQHKHRDHKQTDSRHDKTLQLADQL